MPFKSHLWAFKFSFQKRSFRKAVAASWWVSLFRDDKAASDVQSRYLRVRPDYEGSVIQYGCGGLAETY